MLWIPSPNKVQMIWSETSKGNKFWRNNGHPAMSQFECFHVKQFEFQVGLHFCPISHHIYLVCPKDLTRVSVGLMTVLASCSSPYILLNRALLSSMKVEIDFLGNELPEPVQESWLRRIMQGRSRIRLPSPLSASIVRQCGRRRHLKKTFEKTFTFP